MRVGALWDELERSVVPLMTTFRSRISELEVVTKPDRTLLSEADIAVQEHIVARINDLDPGASIVAEEDDDAGPRSQDGKYTWIVDPIDGTAEFVRPERTEFCSVVCLLEDRRPVAALVVAPEIGHGRSPVVVRVESPDLPIEVNSTSVPREPASSAHVSMTRSSSSAPRRWETRLADSGFILKIRTTSQTLDMVRTAVDLSRLTDPPMAPFAAFFRERQKVWDGAAGMCLAQHQGLRVCDAAGVDRDVVDLDLADREPTFASTLVAPAVLAGKIVSYMA
jgi:3'(2'), 5'-bisphosphate nucleotidase